MSQRSTAQHCHIDTPFCTIRKSHVTWNFAVPVPHTEEIRRYILLFLCTLGFIDKFLTWVSGLPRSMQHYHADTPFCTIRKSHVTWNFAVPGPHSEEIRHCILLFLCTLGTIHMKDLEISKSSILKKKRKWRTKILDQSELEPETPGSRNVGLSIWAIYNSTTRSGKRVRKYSRPPYKRSGRRPACTVFVFLRRKETFLETSSPISSRIC